MPGAIAGERTIATDPVRAFSPEVPKCRPRAEGHLEATATLHVKGKDDVVEDGDIVNIRHGG